ncbi:MAG: capsule assembly Wzi family protein [Treponemataceae bacterium]|nr:capsule assembly Wzi family protein [Treponemataceae bacterium]
MLFFIGTVPLFSLFTEPFRIIEVGDPLLDEYYSLVRLAGASVLSMTPPLGSEEIRRSLEDLATTNPGEQWRERYQQLMNALAEQPLYQEGAFGFSAHPEIAMELQGRTNGALSWIKEESSSKGVITVPLEFFFADRLYARGDLTLRNDPSFYENNGKPWYTNVPLDIQQLDMNMPLRAYMAAGGSWWDVQLGRDRVSYGVGNTGNLALSDSTDYYDFVRFSLFSTNFKYSFLITQLPLSLSANLYTGSLPAGTLQETTQRYLYLHRWDFRLWNRLSVGITEGVLVGNSPLELRFLNPLSIFHSFFSWRDYEKWNGTGDLNGSLISIDFEWNGGGGVSFYGQAVMNQYTTPYEAEHWPDEISPNGFGWLGGFSYIRYIQGWQSRFYIEGVYTDPYLYMLSSPFASFVWMRRLSELTTKDLRYRWIGYERGRDVVVGALGGQFKKVPFSVVLQLLFESRGEHGLIWDWQDGMTAYQERTPTGVAQNSFVFSGQVQWQLLPNLSISLFGALQQVFSLHHEEGNNQLGIEGALTIRYRW